MSEPSVPSGKSVAHDAMHDLLHFDRKIFRTLPVLLFKPGLLTKKALESEQAAYVKPFGLFVFLNFVFFVIKSKGLFNYTLDGYYSHFERFITSKQKALHLSTELLTERFNTAMHFEEKEYLVLMVPLLAFILQLLYLRRKKSFAEHFVFSLHFYSYFIVLLMALPLLFLLLQWLVQLVAPHADIFESEWILVGVIFVANYIYIAPALKLVYAGPLLLTSLKSAALSIAVILLIAFVYRTLMFFVVMHAISE